MLKSSLKRKFISRRLSCGKGMAVISAQALFVKVLSSRYLVAVTSAAT